MEYTVQKLGRLAGVSARTLRYYDEIGLLRPARINSSGYRIYGAAQVDLLQQILFYREMGLSLERIREIVSDPGFDQVRALQEHRKELLARRAQLDMLIVNVDKSIAQKEGRVTMSDKEKFAGFKQKLVEENEQKYGKEVRSQYGERVVNESNQKVLNMSEEEYDQVNRLNEELMETLKAGIKTGDPAGDLGQKAADLHRQWLCHYWPKYDKQAHASLAQMYVDDERFTAYYDKEQPGTAAFLRDAILIYTGVKQ